MIIISALTPPRQQIWGLASKSGSRVWRFDSTLLIGRIYSRRSGKLDCDINIKARERSTGPWTRL